VVRLTHWGIVIAVVANAVVTEGGSGVHVWIGYGLAALLILRLLWGVIGSPEARFAAFPPNPRAAFEHAGKLVRGEHSAHVSHNPLGALNVYAIWACLAVVVASGIAMAGAPPLNFGSRTERSQDDDRRERESPARDHARDSDGSEVASRVDGGEDREREKEEDAGEVVEEVHETAVYLLYLLIALHLGGVLLEAGRNGPGLVARMMPGRR
jgi:cytochrome b